jgi:ubiquinol-cytochrome c reductase cytochrome b subunit
MLNSLRERFNIPQGPELKKKIWEMIDNRVRIITAGLSMKEIRAILRGDPPTEKPNPRYKVITTSFIAHLRPRYYPQAATWFRHTLRLGWFTTFFFVVEVITGLILMIYYVPFPSNAYESILEIESNVFLGEFFRDMHRLGAEAMVIFTWLHMFRTYFTGSYKGQRTFTWLTGVILLMMTAWLSFSGYLLTWDQLGYWAITVGTSMSESGPIVGPAINILLRGAPDIGAGGLLRFYLNHVVLFPLLAILVISIHYYKVSREHGISLPAVVEEGNLSKDERKEVTRRIDLIPDLLSHELFLTAVGLLGLVLILYFGWFNSPLEGHANPQQTPLDTKAPWYFWWLQGLLKIDPKIDKMIEGLFNPIVLFMNGTFNINIGLVEVSQYLNSKFIMGLIVPPVMIIGLMAVPYVDYKNQSRLAKNRPFAIAWGIGWIFAILALSYMGLPEYGIHTPAVKRIIQDLAPEEGLGELREIPYEELVSGSYIVGDDFGRDLCSDLHYEDHITGEEVFGCPHLTSVFSEYSERLLHAEEEGELLDLFATFTIEEFGPSLKLVTLHAEWTDPITDKVVDYGKEFFLHLDRARSH